MKNNQKLNTANSETLKTTEKFREAMTFEKHEGVANFVTEDVDDNASKYNAEEELNGNNEAKNSEEEYDYDENCNERRIIKIKNWCDESNNYNVPKFVITKKFQDYAQKIMAGLLAATKNSVLVVGDHGTGKKTVVKYVAHCIANKKAPFELCNYKTAIYDIDVDPYNFTSDLFVILEYAKTNGMENVIICINDFTKVPTSFIVEYDSISSNISEFGFKIFKFIFIFHEGLEMEEAEVQGYADFFKMRSIFIDVVPANNPKNIVNVLQYEVAKLEKFHGVTISKKILEKLLMCYYARHYGENFDYTLFLNVVDVVLAQVRAKGKSIATNEAIIEYYKRSFEIMSKLPKEYNRVTAVHESGHILLALKIPKLYEVDGCSIIRETNTAVEAITCLRKTFYCAYSEEEVIKVVAMILAGRAAEFEIFEENNRTKYWWHKCKSFNKGAIDDLDGATKELKAWVMNSGAYVSTGINICEGNYERLSEAKKKKVDRIVNRLIKKAYKHARATVKNNKKFIIQMSKFLLKNYVATPEDIKLIARNTIKK